MESVDKFVADTEATLAAEHLTDNTYIVFSSDNGYHLGQHRLVRGKQTAFDTDIRVPLIVAGPGVPAGRVVSQVVAERRPVSHLRATRRRRSRARVSTATACVPLLHPSKHGDRRGAPSLSSSTTATTTRPADPDYEGGGSNPTTYEAIRISAPHLRGFSGPVEAVYVEYADRAARARVLRHRQGSLRDPQRGQRPHR